MILTLFQTLLIILLIFIYLHQFYNLSCALRTFKRPLKQEVSILRTAFMNPLLIRVSLIFLFTLYIYINNILALCESSYIINTSLDNRLEDLKTYLSTNPAALFDALNSSVGNDIIDLSIKNNKDHWDHLKFLWFLSADITGFSSYSWLKSFILAIITINIVSFSLTLLLQIYVYYDIDKLKYLPDLFRKGTISLNNTTLSSFILYHTEIFTVYYFTIDIYLHYVTSYMITEIVQGNISPELLNFLTTIFLL